MDKWIVIRADGDEVIGIGHFMRTLAVAEYCSQHNYRPLLICKSAPELVKNKITELRGEIRYLPKFTKAILEAKYSHSHFLDSNEELDAILTFEVIQNSEKNIKFILVDHYALGYEWEKKLGSRNMVAAFDDLADRRHCCRIVIDQTFGRKKQDYNKFIDSRTKVLVGSQYVVLRKEFLTKKKTSSKLSGVTRVLVSMGGADIKNTSLKVLLELINYREKKIEIDVLTSSLNPNLNEIKELINSYPYISLHVDSNDVAGIMYRATLCIGAVGSSTWERFCIGLPAVLCIQAENQLFAANQLEKAGLIELIDFNSKNFSMSLQQRLTKIMNPSFYNENYNRIQACVDGKGAERIYEQIRKELNANSN